ncbi:MAG: prepilin-type N-terminal cleavage/methylation domain-containing protein [Deltaproteobacteria bacterium]|nr:prepilin-type N-terminal cleavage/methylation domain-containing protein [Deltaproteobacteria bacterium]
MRSKKGFTLVELAIVLVIIGIILAGIIKGQEMITTAKIKRAYNAQKEVAAAIYTYYDRYGKYPGDDNTAQTRWGAATYNGNGNGVIEGGTAGTDAAPGTMFTCAAATASESCAIWEHLRLAGLISGTATAGSGRLNPTHPYGGTVAVASAAISGLTVNWIGMSMIPQNVTQSIDIQNDDGNATTGSIRGNQAFTSPITETPVSQFYKL